MIYLLMLITANATQIASNKTAIDAIDTEAIATAKDDIAANKTAIDAIDTDAIAANTADISTNADAITANATANS